MSHGTFQHKAMAFMRLRSNVHCDSTQSELSVGDTDLVRNGNGIAALRATCVTLQFKHDNTRLPNDELREAKLLSGSTFTTVT